MQNKHTLQISVSFFPSHLLIKSTFFHHGFNNLFIDGELNATGTAANRIEITSNSSTPSPGDWENIAINPSGHADIIYCNITYGNIALDIASSDYNNIRNCNISLCDWIGVWIRSSSQYNNITGNNITSNVGDGIQIEQSYYTNITGNNCTNNSRGIYLRRSFYSDIYSNQMWDNTVLNIDFFAVNNKFPDEYNHNIATSNEVNGKPVYYFYGLNDQVFSNLEGGHITIAGSDKVTLTNCNVTKGDGIKLAYSSNCTISDCNMSSNNEWGIYLGRSSNNTIKGNNASFNGEGIVLSSSTYNNITDNDVFLNVDEGVSIRTFSNWNNITNNNLTSNKFGIHGWSNTHNFC